METQPADVASLTKEITIEILNAFSLPKGELWQNTIGRFFKKPAWRFSEIFAKFDQDCAKYGLREGARRLLPFFVKSVQAIGVENIPSEGPVLVACNHPGVADGVSIVANAPRDDFKVIVGGMPFLQKLPFARRFTIPVPRGEDAVRANAVKISIRHLREGGALLILPSGQIDPDPAVLPRGKEALDNWSKSIAIMMRRAPDTKFVPTIASGVLHEKFVNSKLTFLKSDGVGKRRIMEFIQVLRQLVYREKLDLEMLLTFGMPVSLPELSQGGRGDSNQILQAMIDRAKSLFDSHVSILNQSLEPHQKLYAG